MTAIRSWARFLAPALLLGLLALGTFPRAAADETVSAKPAVEKTAIVPAIEITYDNLVGCAMIQVPNCTPRPFDFQDVPPDEVGKTLLVEDSIKAAWDEKFGKDKPRVDFHPATDGSFIKAGKCTGGALYIVLYRMPDPSEKKSDKTTQR